MQTQVVNSNRKTQNTSSKVQTKDNGWRVILCAISIC